MVKAGVGNLKPQGRRTGSWACTGGYGHTGCRWANAIRLQALAENDFA